MAETTHYIQAGILLISVPNLIVIGLLFVVFFLAIALRIPHTGVTSHAIASSPDTPAADTTIESEVQE